MNEKKLFLLDAMALIYRAYYGLIRNPRETTAGKNTSAQFGFTNTLIELLHKEKPTHIAVAFDTHAPTERHIDFEAYKANRQEAPEDLIASLPDIKRIIKGFNIPVVELDGYEADDVIGAIAKQAELEGFDVYMVTPDKDYGQLVSEKIFIYKPPAFGNKSEILGVKEVCERWGIQNVSQVIDILGLMGDAVDNIPGIMGVGEKTASKLIATYGTLENVLDNAEQIKGAMGEKIKTGKEAAIMSKKLATIILNVPVVFNAEEYKLSEFNKEALNEIFAELEFKTMGKRILGDSFNITSSSATLKAPAKVNKSNQTDLFATETDAPEAPLMPAILPEPEIEEGLIADKNINNTPHQYILVDTDEALQELITTLSAATEICFDTETTGLDANQADIVGASFSIKSGTAWYVPFSANRQEAITKLMLFNSIFENENIRWIGQNIKYDLLILKRHGFTLKGNLFDTMLAHYLIEPEGRRSMDLLSAKYLGYQPVSIEELIGKKGKNQITMKDVAIEKIKDYAAEDADITFQLKEIFEPIVNQKQVDKVFYEMENPLIKVLTDMEYEGIKIDVDFLNDYAAQLAIEAKESEESVYAQAGIRFNLASPKQLGEILFDHLKLDPKAKKTKTGQYATGEDILVKMQGTHKIVDDILVFRELTKLKSTYVDALPNLVNPSTGRVHTSYNQAVAVTGRLSSNNPNLQNIPIRTARGREIRKAFVAGGDDFLILSADYSQIELRIVAAISGDENMCEAFRQSKDIHTATAAKVYGIDENEVTKEMRYKAKSVNFGIIYGQGAFGLSQNLGISRTEAKQLIDNYFKEYATVKTYMDNQVIFAKQNGYVQTILGRKRWLKDIHSANAVVRGYAERNAINMPIQGSAADMIKLAMIAIQKEIKGLNLKSKMLLQVHDELVFDAHKTEVEQLKEIIIRCMRNAMPLPHGVPANAEVGVGTNWLEAH